MSTDVPFSPLVADIISASMALTHDTTNRLIESLQDRIADHEAHRKAVEAGVTALLECDYTPSPDAIRRAVFLPSDALVAHFREEPST